MIQANEPWNNRLNLTAGMVDDGLHNIEFQRSGRERCYSFWRGGVPRFQLAI